VESTISTRLLRCLAEQRYGVDTIDAGGAIAVAMDGGLAKFGDGEKAIELMREIKISPSRQGAWVWRGYSWELLGVSHVPGLRGRTCRLMSPGLLRGLV